MIKKETGDILIPVSNFRIHIGLHEQELKDSLFYKELLREERDMQTGYIWYDFFPIAFYSYKIIYSLCFKNSVLDCLHFCVDSDALPKSWANWSKESELKRKHLNEKLLYEIFNDNINEQSTLPSAYHFEWGNIISCYDPRSGQSSIILHYNNN